jgi:gamma-glutamyl:cysteine ligase YbdK (ATP-grasp superfamily)
MQIMPRIFPRPIESAVRTLKRICDDAANPLVLRARAAELLLATYGYAHLQPDEEPRHRTVKQITATRAKVSALDKELSQRIKKDRKQKKLERELDAVLGEKGTE